MWLSTFKKKKKKLGLTNWLKKKKPKPWIHLLSQSAPKCRLKTQAKFYLSIIDDVIESIRELFLDEGLEDRLVDDLRHVSSISPHKSCPCWQSWAKPIICHGMYPSRESGGRVFWSAALGIEDDAVQSNGRPEEGQHQPLQLCAAASC